jgi:hypothetical protein
MNINDANNMVVGLLELESLDEYEKNICSYYDAAQKQISTTVDHIEAEYLIKLEASAEIDLKEYIETHFSKKLLRVRKIFSDNVPERVFGNKYIFTPGTYRVFCYVYPDNISKDTDVTYEFEVSPEAQPAIVYYAAAQCVVNESDQRPYYAFMDRYNNILQNISDSKRQNLSIKFVKLGGNSNGI